MRLAAVLLTLAACGSSNDNPTDAPEVDGSTPTTDGTPVNPTMGEENASNKLDGIKNDPTALAAFMKAMPKGGDLHNHLTGAVWAEQYLAWGAADGDCVVTATNTAVAKTGCGASAPAMPTSGSFADTIIKAWSMEGFVAGSENGHDHFFSTFGKYGLVAGAHRNEDLADIATRAASENQVYIETMFNLGTNTGSLSASLFSGTFTSASIATLYDQLTTNSGFAAAVQKDVAVLNTAQSGYRGVLGCSGATPPAACAVGVRFVAQVSRTGASDQVFGQLVGAFEMAKANKLIVALNLSSPEDDTASINNYDLQMQMLDFLHTKYAASSPLHVTLHAGELVPQYLPTGSTANTFHIKEAVETAHAERIGHGIDIMTESNPTALMAEMAQKGVMVEVCLSSNAQILGVSGTAHPLAAYMAAGVPVALATDDQGVSRSSLAGEMVKAVTDQKLDYRALKKLARTSLEHSFLPGASVWTTLGTAAVADCAATETMPIGGAPSTACQVFLNGSEKATAEWELEKRFLAFEAAQ